MKSIGVSSPKSEYDRGYVPPGCENMEQAEYEKMMLRRCLDYYFPDRKEPEPMCEGWRDELDNNLTSLSETFKLHPECQLIWQKGYGPPDGDKLDVKGWKEYFDAMPEEEYYKMMRRVHILREPPPMWDGWRDELDKNLTSLSEAFKLHPEYQLIWRKGYGPPDSLNLDVKGWEEYLDAMPEDKRLNMNRDLSYRDGDDDIDDAINRQLREKYKYQFTQSEARSFLLILKSIGFDIVVYPVGCCGIIKPMFNDIRPVCASRRTICLSNCSRIALDVYNQREGTDYTVNRVVKGFDIDVYHTDGCGIIKPMFNDTSPVSAETYYMLSNCSRTAVDAYNQREGTDYTVNRVVKVCIQVDGGIMYFITFEAINSKDHFQVFQAKVYDPIIGANKVLLVRPKAMVKDLFMPPRDSHHDAERFDIDVCISDGDGTIVPMSYYDMTTDDSLFNYSRNALSAYNLPEGGGGGGGRISGWKVVVVAPPPPEVSSNAPGLTRNETGLGSLESLVKPGPIQESAQASQAQH
ncbi:hypothetical protein Leryth_001178 [Lithospermum erythrorhizon]|nr:hypothetical protein Leryth_001178 [Lithospermum erythrorhizon]